MNFNYEFLATWLAIGVPASLVVIFCSETWPVMLTALCVIAIEALTVIAGALCFAAGSHDYCYYDDLEVRR